MYIICTCTHIVMYMYQTNTNYMYIICTCTCSHVHVSNYMYMLLVQVHTHIYNHSIVNTNIYMYMYIPYCLGYKSQLVCLSHLQEHQPSLLSVMSISDHFQEIVHLYSFLNVVIQLLYSPQVVDSLEEYFE